MISVIVPVYNAEKYLSDCINSILSQSYRDFEILLVDDGSTDRSGIICDEFTSIYTNVRVFHKNNGGVSSARNAGIEQAMGEWITFVDADDTILPDYLEKLAINSKGVDLVLCGLACTESNMKFVPSSFQSFHLQDLNTDEFSILEKELLNINFTGCCCKLYNKQVVCRKSIRFDENFKYSEDLLFILSYVSAISKIRIIPYCTYLYRDSFQQTQSRYRLSADAYFYNFTTLLKALDELKKHTMHQWTLLRDVICNNETGHFYYNLLFLDYSLFLKEIRIFKNREGIWYTNSFKKKFWVFFLIYFPHLGYLITKVLRMKYAK